MTTARVCCCTALFTLLACGGPEAAKAPEKKVEVTKTEVKADPAKVTNPHANPHANIGVNPHAAPPTAPKGPVNPTEVTPSGKVRAETIDGLALSVPEEWVRRPGSNPMRLAEFVLPGPGGEVTLVVSRFAGGGGDATSNVERWKTQFTRADGSDIGDAAKVTVVDKAPLKITTVDIEGTNIAPVTPGAPERYNEPGSRLLGAIVEGSGDPYFFKAAGSAKTLTVWEPAFRAAIETMAAAK
ncbi:MAG: hypothetical protein JNL82_26815 [Myxococcales bacterium]|nr:hypothetical protein [Myxococcales bacterium]